jgi:hypothetical protein
MATETSKPVAIPAESFSAKSLKLVVPEPTLFQCLLSRAGLPATAFVEKSTRVVAAFAEPATSARPARPSENAVLVFIFIVFIFIVFNICLIVAEMENNGFISR